MSLIKKLKIKKNKKNKKKTVIVIKFFNEKFFQRLGYWVSPLTVQNRLDRRQSV